MPPHRISPRPGFLEFSRDTIERSIPERFEEQVALYPNRLAIKSRLEQFTYIEFNRSANRLARTIRHQSSNHKPIAVILEHDAGAIITILAVLKTGKCFIPLDPSLPRARLNYMLEDSEAEVIVTNSQFTAVVQKLLNSDRTLINVDQLDPSLNVENLGISIAPDQLSCILYTSGSTGQPKGVMHTHGNELHNVMHHTNSLYLSPDDRLTLLGSYSTGQGIQDLYCALLNGAALFPWNLKANGLSGLADWLIAEEISVYHSAATVFRHFVRNLSAEKKFPFLRVVRLGSEQVSWKDVESFTKHFSKQCVFVNALSSSETKTVRQYVLAQGSQVTGMVPVGYPVDDMDILVLDEFGNEVAINQTGEIAVRSKYLSPGYWRKADLTTAAYLPDPDDPTNRIFRTGEWGRISPDGCLYHLGRKDAQVKIRGYRVETYETELALLQHPAVEQTLVICREDKRGDRFLVAYVVLRQDSILTVSELRDFLSKIIPAYMVPAGYIFLESFPLAPNGKIDRSSLPEPGTERPRVDVEFVTPGDAIEQNLSKVWADLLEVKEVGVNDNFFDLGGNSILAMQVVAWVEREFRARVPLQNFFASPTVRMLNREISLALAIDSTVETPPIMHVGRNRHFPLSLFQQRLWFFNQLDPGKPFYTICRAYRMIGKLDVRAMDEGLNAIIARHESLRTLVCVQENEPTQVILPILRVKLDCFDLQDLKVDERNARSNLLLKEEAGRPFKITNGPLIRARLIRLGEEDHIFTLSAHQMVCDGWSMHVLLKEFWAFYDALRMRKVPFLPFLKLQYADFTVWQRQLLESDRLAPQITYWKNQLGGSLPSLNLPTDRPRPNQQTFQGARIPLILPESLADALNEFSRVHEATLFMVLMAAFKVLLYRYTGQEELTVGFPIATRNWADTAGLIGFFVNTLVLRTHPSGNLRFKEFLMRVKKACVCAYANQDVPFERMVEELGPERDMSRNPIFQALFTFQSAQTDDDYSPQAIRSAPIDVDSGTSKFDLTLALAERQRKLVGSVEYSSDLFDGSTIDRMIGHFETLLYGVVADPDQFISDVPMLTKAERNQLQFDWNHTEASYPKDTCIHQLFEAQVERTPEATALRFDGKPLSYRQLNVQANQLARHLQQLGIGPQKLVGICMERSLEMMVGLLAILKAGAAYVPLDPNYPKERLALIAQDAKLSILLTDARLLQNGLPSGLTPKVFRFNRDEKTLAGQSRDNLSNRIHSDDLAYVIYTSGSTGTPKGVGGLHRGAVNRFAWMWKAYPFRRDETCCIKTSLNFVDSVWEVFGPLLQGVPSVILPDEAVKDPRWLTRILADNHVSRIALVPSLLRSILNSIPDVQDHLPDLNLWCVSGEMLSNDLAEQFRQNLPRSILLNLYGSTEASADATHYEVRTIYTDHRVPIGRPISNTQVYIVDGNLHLAPIGVPGELCVAGDGLARGYLSRPELTAEKFIPNPFNSDPASRLYLTGDLARYLADGDIELLGRSDNQVKIRGYRIELGEVESALNQHPAVKNSVVLACEREASSDKELVGYLVPCERSTLSVTELRSFLREKLPDYMIPSLVVFLESFPLTPNGKIDRNALPPPDGTRPLLDQGFLEPRTEIEELVAQVWRDVLKLEKVGVHDNFFELGGHSLLATRVVARLCSNLHVDLALRKLFELPTVAELAQHIDLLRRSGAGAVIAPIVPVPRDRPLPLSFSQRRLWYLQKVDTNLSAYNIPAAFRIKGDLDSAALEQALNDVIDRHEVLRSYVKEIDGQPRQESSPGLRISLPVIDLTALPDEQAEAEANRLFNADARQLYDLKNAPLLRATLAKLGANDHVLIFNFHHIIADGSSLAILYRELAVLYDAARAGKAVSLPPLPIQYADFAAWQHDWLKSSAFDTQLDYWRRQLASLPEPCSLPTDFDRPMIPSHLGARLSLPLSDELTSAIKSLSRQQGVTTFMTLFAAFNLLLSRVTGQEDVVIGSTIAGRNHPETEGLIGFFINALPLRGDLSGDPSFVVLLQRVRESCLDAYTHQDVPFEKIVEEIKPRREPGRNPIFDILFNVADVSERVLTLAECEVSKLTQANPEAKFDIVLHAPETNGKIDLAIVYNTALFDDSRIVLVLRQWAALLAQVTSDSDLPISQLSLVTDESRALLPEPTEILDDKWKGAIHEMLGDRARRSPDSLAVVDPEQSWTYREIDEATNRLANALIAAEVQPKDTVAIYAERSSCLLVAIFGILKAGATFLILDPAYPPARTLEYLRIAQPKGWLQLAGSSELSHGLPGYLDRLDLRCRMTIPGAKSDRLQALSRFSDRNLEISITANDPAYIAFTSGSTGEPKGVVCRHGPITHFLPWQKETFGLIESDRFAMLSGLAYSHLHRDVFTAIHIGATIYIPNPSQARSPDQLAHWLEQNAITVLHLTPALGQLLLTGAETRLPLVRRVFFGGDVLTMDEVARIRELAPNAIVGSFYGATETQRAVAYYEITDDIMLNGRASNKPVPLGRGIKDVQLLVLHKSGRLAGVGELGDLFVRSPHLAAGYIGDDELTRQMFVTNPFTNDPSDRLYRTGELGRYLPNGNVEWAGRNDRRVNIRGFRVELEEIEIALKRHPAVKDAAVVLRDYEIVAIETSKLDSRDLKLDQRLVAYVAADERGQSLIDLLQSYLTTRLPQYMVPAHFVILQSLPLSPNGKVDHRALPRIQFSTGPVVAAAPRNEIERKLLAMFAEVLGRADIGVDENFFRIGGHSLLAARVAVRIGDTLGVNLDLSAFLETPTVIGLAKKVHSLRATGQTTIESDKDQREEFDL